MEHSDTQRRYAEAEPIWEMIQFLRILQLEGHKIIIYTARRMLTHNGDIAKIEADVGDVTRQWLSDYNVPYDLLVFGKPYGDFYIDDKAINVKDLFPSDNY